MSRHRNLWRTPAIMILAATATFSGPQLADAKPSGGGSTPLPTTTTVATSYAGRAYGLGVGATALIGAVKLGPVLGGQLVSSTGAGVSFGIVGGQQASGLMGHFNAVDHGIGADPRRTSVSGNPIARGNIQLHTPAGCGSASPGGGGKRH